MNSATLDRIGAIASMACAIHCMLTGLALGVLSVVGLGFLGSPRTEVTFLTVTFTVGIFALVTGWRKHRSVWPGSFFVGGLSCWYVSHAVFGHGHVSDHAHGPWGTLFAVLGGACLVTFHVLNQRLPKKCTCEYCSGH